MADGNGVSGQPDFQYNCNLGHLWLAKLRFQSCYPEDARQPIRDGILEGLALLPDPQESSVSESRRAMEAEADLWRIYHEFLNEREEARRARGRRTQPSGSASRQYNQPNVSEASAHLRNVSQQEPRTLRQVYQPPRQHGIGPESLQLDSALYQDDTVKNYERFRLLQNNNSGSLNQVHQPQQYPITFLNSLQAIAIPRQLYQLQPLNQVYQPQQYPITILNSLQATSTPRQVYQLQYLNQVHLPQQYPSTIVNSLQDTSTPRQVYQQQSLNQAYQPQQYPSTVLNSLQDTSTPRQVYQQQSLSRVHQPQQYPSTVLNSQQDPARTRQVRKTQNFPNTVPVQDTRTRFKGHKPQHTNNVVVLPQQHSDTLKKVYYRTQFYDTPLASQQGTDTPDWQTNQQQERGAPHHNPERDTSVYQDSQYQQEFNSYRGEVGSAPKLPTQKLQLADNCDYRQTQCDGASYVPGGSSVTGRAEGQTPPRVSSSRVKNENPMPPRMYSSSMGVDNETPFFESNGEEVYGLQDFGDRFHRERQQELRYRDFITLPPIGLSFNHFQAGGERAQQNRAPPGFPADNSAHVVYNRSATQSHSESNCRICQVMQASGDQLPIYTPLKVIAFDQAMAPNPLQSQHGENYQDICACPSRSVRISSSPNQTMVESQLMDNFPRPSELHASIPLLSRFYYSPLTSGGLPRPAGDDFPQPVKSNCRVTNYPSDYPPMEWEDLALSKANPHISTPLATESGNSPPSMEWDSLVLSKSNPHISTPLATGSGYSPPWGDLYLQQFQNPDQASSCAEPYPVCRDSLSLTVPQNINPTETPNNLSLSGEDYPEYRLFKQSSLFRFSFPSPPPSNDPYALSYFSEPNLSPWTRRKENVSSDFFRRCDAWTQSGLDPTFPDETKCIQKSGALPETLNTECKSSDYQHRSLRIWDSYVPLRMPESFERVPQCAPSAANEPSNQNNDLRQVNYTEYLPERQNINGNLQPCKRILGHELPGKNPTNMYQNNIHSVGQNGPHFKKSYSSVVASRTKHQIVHSEQSTREEPFSCKDKVSHDVASNKNEHVTGYNKLFLYIGGQMYSVDATDEVIKMFSNISKHNSNVRYVVDTNLLTEHAIQQPLLSIEDSAPSANDKACYDKAKQSVTLPAVLPRAIVKTDQAGVFGSRKHLSMQFFNKSEDLPKSLQKCDKLMDWFNKEFHASRRSELGMSPSAETSRGELRKLYKRVYNPTRSDACEESLQRGQPKEIRDISPYSRRRTFQQDRHSVRRGRCVGDCTPTSGGPVSQGSVKRRCSEEQGRGLACGRKKLVAVRRRHSPRPTKSPYENLKQNLTLCYN